jgi:hypothetical protein
MGQQSQPHRTQKDDSQNGKKIPQWQPRFLSKSKPSGKKVPCELLLADGQTKGPSIYSYCPLTAGGCFVMIMMIQATKEQYEFEEVTANMKTHADMIGF